jgi:hypothetical protein
MNIPNFIDSQVVNEKGYLTDTWKQIFTQLFTQLQSGLSDEGLVVPNQSATNIAQLNGKLSALLIESDTGELKININGTFKTIQTS